MRNFIKIALALVVFISLKKKKKNAETEHQTFEKTSDLYCLFHELGNIILKENGLLGFITSTFTF